MQTQHPPIQRLRSIGIIRAKEILVQLEWIGGQSDWAREIGLYWFGPACIQNVSSEDFALTVIESYITLIWQAHCNSIGTLYPQKSHIQIMNFVIQLFMKVLQAYSAQIPGQTIIGSGCTI